MQVRTVSVVIALSIAGFGGVILLVGGGALAWLASSGGLYGNGSLADASILDLAIGTAVFLLSFLPLGFILLLATFWWRAASLPRWSSVLGWLVAASILSIVFVDIASTTVSRHGFSFERLGLATLPVLPFTLGLMGFLLLARKSDVH